MGEARFDARYKHRPVLTVSLTVESAAARLVTHSPSKQIQGRTLLTLEMHCFQEVVEVAN